MIKKTPTPEHGAKVPSGVHAMRRGGARREVTERVTLKPVSPAPGSAEKLAEKLDTLEGWALNVSRGGVRAILEERVHLGQRFDVAIGTDETLRPSRVVWVQEEPDGVIVGLEFTGSSGTHKAAPPDDSRPNGADPGGGVSED